MVSDLDFLRGAAAIAVVLSHVVPAVVADRAEVGSRAPGYWLFHAPAAFGRVAVLLFFVLSGYLVSRSVLLGSPERRWQRYAIARSSRILTVFWPALVLGVGLDLLGLRWFGHVGLYAGQHPSHSLAPSDMLERLTPTVFFANAAFLQMFRAPVLGSNVALWSLSYEAWFYVAFPFVVIAAERRSRVGVAAAMLALVLVGMFVGYTLASYFAFWMLGVAITWTERRGGVRFGLRARVLALLITLALSLLHSRLPGEWLRDALVATAEAGLVATLVLRDPAPRPALFAVVSRRLADVSYSLYLVHVPLVVFLATALGVPPRAPVSLRALAHVAVLLVAVAAYAVLVFWLIERRTPAVRAWLERRFLQPEGKSSA